MVEMCRFCKLWDLNEFPDKIIVWTLLAFNRKELLNPVLDVMQVHFELPHVVALHLLWLVWQFFSAVVVDDVGKTVVSE